MNLEKLEDWGPVGLPARSFIAWQQLFLEVTAINVRVASRMVEKALRIQAAALGTEIPKE